MLLISSSSLSMYQCSTRIQEPYVPPSTATWLWTLFPVKLLEHEANRVGLRRKCSMCKLDRESSKAIRLGKQPRWWKIRFEFVNNWQKWNQTWQESAMLTTVVWKLAVSEGIWRASFPENGYLKGQWLNLSVIMSNFEDKELLAKVL